MHGVGLGKLCKTRTFKQNCCGCLMLNYVAPLSSLCRRDPTWSRSPCYALRSITPARSLLEGFEKWPSVALALASFRSWTQRTTQRRGRGLATRNTSTGEFCTHNGIGGSVNSFSFSFSHFWINCHHRHPSAPPPPPTSGSQFQIIMGQPTFTPDRIQNRSTPHYCRHKTPSGFFGIKSRSACSVVVS